MCWKAHVRATVKWSTHAIYLCLPPLNACKKKPLIHFSFEVLLLGSNRLQGTHLTLIPSTCDYQWLTAMYITWRAVLQQHSYTQYSSCIESKYKLEYKYGLWSDLRAPNFNSGGVSPQTPLACACLRTHHRQCIDNTAVLYYLWSVPPQSQYHPTPLYLILLVNCR